ncbi:hypothetical protein GCM10009806_03500 [Microbacterium flavum]
MKGAARFDALSPRLRWYNRLRLVNYGVAIAFACFVAVVPFVAGAEVGYLVFYPLLGAILVALVFRVGLRRWGLLDRVARRAAVGESELLCTFARVESSSEKRSFPEGCGWLTISDSDLIFTLSTIRGDVLSTLSWPLVEIAGAQRVEVSGGREYSDLYIDVVGGESVTVSTNQPGGWNIRPMTDTDIDRLAARLRDKVQAVKRAP